MLRNLCERRRLYVMFIKGSHSSLPEALYAVHHQRTAGRPEKAFRKIRYDSYIVANVFANDLFFDAASQPILTMHSLLTWLSRIGW